LLQSAEVSSIPAASVFSPQELARFEGEAGIEFVNGKVVEKPVSVETSEVEATMSRLLGNEASKTREARVFGSTMGYKCFREEPARFRKPDISVVRSERMREIRDNEGFMPIAPDLAVEVLSPTDLIYDVMGKVDEYLRNSFPLVWLVHPNIRAVTVHRADGSMRMFHGEDEITGENALPTFRCKVKEFFTPSR
jgi:Uma2 family endonuclease